jgi:multidrug resistance efflux pump
MGKIISRGYWFNLRPHLLPVVVWLAVVACVVGLFSYRSKRFEVLGIAQGQVWQVAATCTGRLKSVSVGLFDEVKQGQTVAVINTLLEDEQALNAKLKGQLATISAEIDHLSAQLAPLQDKLLAEKADRENTRMEEERRFSTDVETARIRILNLRAGIASDSITLENLAMEVKIVEDLLKEDAVAPYELQKTRVQYNSLAKKLEENKQSLAQASEDLKQALERQQKYHKFQPYNPSIETALDTIRKEIKVQEQNMEGVTAQLDAMKARESVELKAPFDGVVVPIVARTNEAIALRPGEKIVRRPGEVVNAGDPVVAIAQAQPTEVIAYATERTLGRVREKMPVELVKDRTPAQIARSEVVSVGPTVELMPQRLWRNPNVPQWGRPIRIKIPSGLQLLPGEVVGIREM